jgi:hypothetical protein
MQYAAVFPDPVRALARISLFSNASGMDLAWIRVGWANPMSANARRILASSKCEKEPNVVLDSTRDSSAMFWVRLEGTEANEAGLKTVGDSRRKLCFRSPRSSSPQQLRVTEMYPYTQLHLGKARTVAVAGSNFLVLGSEYVLVFRSSQRRPSHTALGFRTGKLEGSTTNFDEQNATDLLKSGPIRFSAVDAEFEHFVTVGEDKKLKVWELYGPKLRSQRFVLAPPFV